MRINYTILKDLLRKSAVILIVLALVQVLYISEQPVIPEAHAVDEQDGEALLREMKSVIPDAAMIGYVTEREEKAIVIEA